MIQFVLQCDVFVAQFAEEFLLTQQIHSLSLVFGQIKPIICVGKTKIKENKIFNLLPKHVSYPIT